MTSLAIPRSALFAVLVALAGSAAVAGGACDSSVPSDQGGQGGTSSSTTAASTTASASSGGTGGAGTGGATGSGGAPDCYANPMTYLEIINACTDAQKVDVTPVLPLLEADGGLPPLP